MNAPKIASDGLVPDDTSRANGEQRGGPAVSLPVAGAHLETALSWLLDQWLSDVDSDWATHVLDGLRADDPDIFDTLDDVNVADAGRGLL